MRPDSFRGIALALTGALVLSPDTLFMRLSGLDAAQMMGWRGSLMAATLILFWAATTRDRGGDLRCLITPAGLGAAACQGFNGMAFAYGIAVAPVSVVLFALATVPIWSAALGALVLGDRVGRATAITSAVVLAGIGLSVFSAEGGHGAGGSQPLIGALCGLAVAVAMAGSFTIYRARPALPVPLTVGAGAAVFGAVGWAVAGPMTQTGGVLPAIWVCGVLILPASFVLLSVASRHTPSANVSLLLLLETALGPILVWGFLGEAMTGPELVGGGIVVAALAVYLRHRRRVREAPIAESSPPPPAPPR
ncbi:DMT family transporter [Palleronia sediminis]|uniref:DMT family transporter n=1 Tax=Palleronia sediminis TaxID=2547833 RepID=A0A4R6A6L9_9RHOB|nr:DMT family transporter [Palleronia sediminis]TDL78367.1 DMT family transporter [Palleronia sediminis]